MKHALFIPLIALVMVSCAKDQKAVNKLEGTWNATKWEVSDGGLTLDLIALGGSASIVFEGCDVKDSWCNYTAYTSFLGVSDTISSLYRVTDAGNTLQLQDSTSVNSSEILELSDSFLRIRDNSGSPSTEIEAAKQ